jgi:phosphoribosyl-AMP cyclohydrolase
MKLSAAALTALLGAIRWGADGLVPVIVQDAHTQAVLTLAYMNREALTRTLELGETVFWSRSRQELWHKGATSGHIQKVVEIRVDCDADALLIQVKPAGPACHTGAVTCFFRTLDALTKDLL